MKCYIDEWGGSAKIILNGRFIENEYVTVLIGNEKITRKVHYDTTAGDLFIWYKNGKYFYCEF